MNMWGKEKAWRLTYQPRYFGNPSNFKPLITCSRFTSIPILPRHDHSRYLLHHQFSYTISQARAAFQMAGKNPTPPIPIIIGISDIKNPSLAPRDAMEPLHLMLKAIQAAIKDTGLTGFFAADLQSSIDSISVVATWTWPYDDLPGLLATKLGVRPSHKVYSEHGGNQPAKLVDEAARRIANGQSTLAVVTGGEALASCTYGRLISTRGKWNVED